VTATPASGYQFVGWTGNVADTGKSSTTVTITGDMTVTANFEKHDGGTIIIDIPWPE